MVTRFSGTSNAKAMKRQYDEVKNRFDMFDEFAQVYETRQDSDFSYKMKESHSRDFFARVDSTAQYTLLKHRHQGTLLHQKYCASSTPALVRSHSNGSLKLEVAKKQRTIASPLFFWIVSLFAGPLLLATVTLSVVVMHSISSDFPAFVENVKSDFIHIDLFALQVSIDLRPQYDSAVTARPTRDLHLVTRYASWALFGGINRSNSFTEITTGAEMCKGLLDSSQCGFVREFTCDCTWLIDQFKLRA